MEATMKDCLLICNKNATTLKEVFPLIKNKILRMGYTVPKDYDQPPGYEYKSLQGLTRWMTTLSVSNKPPLILTATYNPDKYPKYDNYDAVECKFKNDIPIDYQGKIGIPDSFWFYYPELDYEVLEHRGDLKLNGKTVYERLIIQKKK